MIRTALSLQLLLFAIVALAASAFLPSSPLTLSSSRPRRCFASPSLSKVLHLAKGFGEKAPNNKKQKSEGQVERETKAAKYDEISAAGGQEYNVYVRQFGSDDDSWLPCGAIAVPREAQVSSAIFSNEAALQSAIVRAYPKLKGYEEEFEYGYNLKVYPDDPVEVAMKGQVRQTSGLSIGNWISTLLSPVDTSNVPPPPAQQ